VIRQAVVILAIVAMPGCLPRTAFAPPPDNWEMWRKPGTEEVVLWKNLLDCGYASPFSGTPVKPDRPTTLSQSASKNDLHGAARLYLFPRAT